MTRRLYALHRIISGLALVQLLAWTASGLFFALVPITRIRGAAVPGAHQRALPAELAVQDPAEIMRRLQSLGLHELISLELRASPAGVFYVARSREKAVRIAASTGRSAPISQAEAEETARRDQPGYPAVAASELLTEPAAIEYRGRPLPAWRVVLKDAARTAVYVDASTGDVTARRNRLWRVYDFLWSLHIMDYRAREDFNHPLLIGAALLGVLTVLSGAVLWALRIRRRLRHEQPPRL